MEVGTDAPSHARLFSAVYADDTGKPVTVPRAVALYERDGGVLWKHFEYYSGSTDARRARELVLFTLVTVGNYDYGINWIFRQDGSLEMQAVFTGIMLAKGVAATKDDQTHADASRHSWHLVAPNVAAPHHQHFLNFRLDLDVDGPVNAVREINAQAVPGGPGNPAYNAFEMAETRASHRARGAARSQPRLRAPVADRQSGRAQCAGADGRLPARSGRELDALPASRITDPPARRVHQPSFLGHAVRPRRTARRRRVSEPERARRRAAEVDRDRPPARRTRRRRLVHLRHHAYSAPRGMAGHERARPPGSSWCR